MVKNVSGLSQIFYHRGKPFEIPPGFVFDPPCRVPKNKDFAEVKSVLDEVEAAETIVVRCTTSLSEVLCLIPVVNEVRSAFTRRREIVLATHAADYRGEVVRLLGGEAFDAVVEAEDIRGGFDVGLSLDVLPESFVGKHKVDAFRSFFGLPTVGEPPVWVEDEDTKGSGSYVVLNEGDSETFKEPISFGKLKLALEEKNRVVSFLRGENTMAAKLVETILEASCLVAVECASFWMAHFTRTPLVAVIRADQDAHEFLKYHPLYSEGVASVKVTPEARIQDVLDAVESVRWKA